MIFTWVGWIEVDLKPSKTEVERSLRKVADGKLYCDGHEQWYED